MAKQSESPPLDDLAKGMVGVIDAALGVGVAMARVSAEFTAGGRKVSPPQPGSSPISVLTHYGLATAGNLFALVSSAGGSRTEAATKPAASAVPHVKPGAKLRVPLSVENRGEKPMNGLKPLLRRVLFAGAETAAALPADCVSFVPEAFSVAPKDFEKLTVFVDVPENAAAGRYDLSLALGSSEPDIPLSFEVTPGDLR